LWRHTSHISGTWSIDGGTTWNQFIDTWDASPLRRGSVAFAASNGVRSSVGELVGGSFREGFTEWGPEDVSSPLRLPGRSEGYRYWGSTPDGTLLGSSRSSAVFVSDGPNWQRVIRRDAGVCSFGPDLVGEYLVCGPQRRRTGPARGRVLVVSDDLARTWAQIPLDAVVPAHGAAP
jgi:hypothetical protein